MIPHEEMRTVKWFMLISYLIVVCYDLFYYIIAPSYITTMKSGFPSNFWFITYFVLAILIPLAVYLNKIGRHTWIKFVFVVSYLLSTSLVDVLSYYGRGDSYRSGNVLEVFLLLSLPLFLSSRFFWVVSIGITIRYLIPGIILKTTYVIMPILFIVVLSIMSYFLLVRFQGYVRALSRNYDNKLEGIVKGVIATLELKDPYTRGHSERVANYACSLAEQLGQFKKEQLKSFYHACLLHDIGKVNIPDSILIKPGKLTKEEFDVIKTHPVVGAEAVKDVDGIKESICVILSHHERWDGKGYPNQLKGENIPLLARVAAVADAFDAMTSSRSYRDALPVDEAYRRVLEGSGSQFDPLIVEEFKKVYPKWVKFHEKYPWTKKWELPKEVEL
ncbi:HD-GYP domain-containing protein [Neobacillus muris]|uniref:HD-GYP domain-containing protein n=1 Tax=Neobacillus muris TaxID=2941334 RepID=UPI00203C132C|nr:HD-GYP domain-containing protein [Neobacillus muris]